MRSSLDVIKKKGMAGRGFTHIVVGAGSAGCVVASRITENENFNILLIEAGIDFGTDEKDMPHGVHDIRRVPMKGQSEAYDERIDWNVQVELGDGKLMHVPQAKLMGGGSSINGGTALRNTPNDSKEWEELGNDAWDFQSVEAVYQSLERADLKHGRPAHPLAKATPEDAGRIQRAFLDGGMENGLRWTGDLNFTGVEGCGASPVCRNDDRRVSLAETFIDPFRSRSNLSIISDTAVDQVLFSGKKAVGILTTDARAIYSSHEVIICAGALFSPAILQRSGIGPRHLLTRLNIPVIADIPVGEQLYDHPTIPVVARPKPDAYSEGDYSLQMQARWSSLLQPRLVDLQMVCFSYLFTEASDSNEQHRSLGGTTNGHVAGIGCNVNKPTSAGRVHIQSKDAHIQPIIDPGYLQTKLDRACARENVRLAYKIMNSAPMRTALGPPLGLTDGVIADDQLLDEWIQANFSSTYHFCGSCRMSKQDLGGVVSSSGHVFCTEGLRVCDASIIPTIPACNTMWPTVMFADRIGCSIRDGTAIQRLIADTTPGRR